MHIHKHHAHIFEKKRSQSDITLVKKHVRLGHAGVVDPTV